MPDPVSGGQAPPRAVPGRVISRVQRAILGALMSLAVIVLERRIRKALRSDGTADPGT
jgi:hypothetical protein